MRLRQQKKPCACVFSALTPFCSTRAHAPKGIFLSLSSQAIKVQVLLVLRRRLKEEERSRNILQDQKVHVCILGRAKQTVVTLEHQRTREWVRKEFLQVMMMVMWWWRGGAWTRTGFLPWIEERGGGGETDWIFFSFKSAVVVVTFGGGTRGDWLSSMQENMYSIFKGKHKSCSKRRTMRRERDGEEKKTLHITDLHFPNF